MKRFALALLVSTMVCVAVLAQEASSKESSKNPSPVEIPVGARTIYIAAFHALNPATVFQGPRNEVAAVAETVRFRITVAEEAEVLAAISQELRSWGRFEIVNCVCNADLLLVFDRGLNMVWDGVCMPLGSTCSHHIQRDSTLSLYAVDARPGLIWRSRFSSAARTVESLRRDVEDTIEPTTIPDSTTKK